MNNSSKETTKTPQEASLKLRQRMKAAWPADKVRQLGPEQEKRLSAWVAADRKSKGEDALTVPVLQGMLEMLQTYFPEESLQLSAS
jgi:hypothetical protein